MKTVAGFFSITLYLSAIAFADDVLESTGRIDSVTVYQQQALVTRHVDVPQGSGLRTIRVTNLPDAIFDDSIFAEGKNGTTVRAVRTAVRVIAVDQGEELKTLQDELKTLQRQHASLQQKTEVLQQQRLSLDRAFGFSVSKASDDLNRASLDPESLIQLTEYSDKRREEISQTRLDVQHEMDDLSELIETKTKSLAKMIANTTRTVRDAIVYVETPADSAGSFRLRYRVGQCGWNPQYTVAGSTQGGDVQLKYGALITQVTGEDWNRVKLVLSTASASVSASGPVLAPLRVTTIDPGDSLLGMSPGSLETQIQNIRSQQVTAEAWSAREGNQAAQRDLTLNTFASQMQRIELMASAQATRQMAPDALDQVSTQNYELEVPVSLTSRQEQQLVKIRDLQFAGEMVHVVTPLLSSYAYRQAEMANSTTIGLMAGPALIYLDGRFVGKTLIPATASGQKLVVGFGADQQIRTRRELMSKTDEMHGGNRRLGFNYRVVVANFKADPVKVRVLDRLPHPRESRDISLRLAEDVMPLSEDALYLRMQRPQGILRWDVEVPANRHGSDAFDVDYSFSAEFDRSKQLTTDESVAINNDLKFQRVNGGGGMGGFGGGFQ